MDPFLHSRLCRLSGKDLRSALRINRGYTPAQRWLLTFADGTTAFAKVGTTPLTSKWLLAEQTWYTQLPQGHRPLLYGIDADPERPILLLQDCSSARWPPPWQPGDVERLKEELHDLSATRPLPLDLPKLEQQIAREPSWIDVERDPEPFLRLGLCTKEWLAQALPVLLEAQRSVVLAGDDLVHCDVRSDNLCWVGERLLLVDWNGPCRGNCEFDLAFLAPSLRLEGGPLPEEFLPDRGSFAALVAGSFASRAGLPAIPDAPLVRWIQLRQLQIALPWAARELGLAPPCSAGH